MNKEEEREKFELWVAVMDEALDTFRDSMPLELVPALDFSPRSLDSLEAWLLSQYATTSAYLKDAPTTLVDGSARYVGEVFRRNLGGHWHIHLDNPRDVNFNLPLIVGYPNQATPLGPHHLVSACMSRRTGKYLSGVHGMQRKLAGNPTT